MKKTNRLWIVAGISLLLMSIWWWQTRSRTSSQQVFGESNNNPKTKQVQVSIGKTSILAEIRRSEAEQALGLSWRPGMAENEGMIFVYDRPQRVSYWMKGMNFPLDFIWVRQGEVVELNKHVLPPTADDPRIKTVTPVNEVDMVIEVNAGFVDRHQVKVGDLIDF